MERYQVTLFHKFLRRNVLTINSSKLDMLQDLKHSITLLLITCPSFFPQFFTEVHSIKKHVWNWLLWNKSYVSLNDSLIRWTFPFQIDRLVIKITPWYWFEKSRNKLKTNNQLINNSESNLKLSSMCFVNHNLRFCSIFSFSNKI